jgi:cytoskeletal protein RodZ
MISLLLKEKRELTGLTLDEISDRLKIRAKYLQAIEENSDAPDIPSPVYMLGYLKVYADFLGLDGQKIITELKATHSEISDLCLPEIYFDDNKPNFNIIGLSLLLLALVAFVWYGVIYKKDVLSEPTSVISQSKKIEMDNSYLLAKDSNPKPPSLETKLKKISYKDYQDAINKDNNEIILVAKSNSNIKVTDKTGKLIIDEQLVRGSVYLVAYEEGIAITVKDKDSVAIFNKGKLLNNKIHSL